MTGFFFRPKARRINPSGDRDSLRDSDPPPESYLSALYDYVTRRIGDNEDAHDIIAQTFASALPLWQRRPRTPFDGVHDPTIAWLIGIARRKMADLLRQRQRDRRTHAPQTTDEDPLQTLLGRERREALWEAMAQLGEPQREALLLKYVEGFSLEEVAHVLNRSVPAAGSLLYRARTQLRTQMESYGQEWTRP